MQTKKEIFIEKCWDVGIGFIIAWTVTRYIVPLFDPTNMTSYKSAMITLMMTFFSFSRTFIVRMVFNAKEK